MSGLAWPSRGAIAATGTCWAISQTPWGVAQVVEVQPAVAEPGMLEPGSGEGGCPDAGEVVGGQGAPAAAAAGWGGEDPVVGLRVVGEALPVIAEGLGGGLVEGDGALGGGAGRALVAAMAAAAGVGEHAADAQAAGSRSRAFLPSPPSSTIGWVPASCSRRGSRWTCCFHWPKTVSGVPGRARRARPHRPARSAATGSWHRRLPSRERSMWSACSPQEGLTAEPGGVAACPVKDARAAVVVDAQCWDACVRLRRPRRR